MRQVDLAPTGIGCPGTERFLASTQNDRSSAETSAERVRVKRHIEKFLDAQNQSKISQVHETTFGAGRCAGEHLVHGNKC